MASHEEWPPWPDAPLTLLEQAGVRDCVRWLLAEPGRDLEGFHVKLIAEGARGNFYNYAHWLLRRAMQHLTGGPWHRSWPAALLPLAFAWKLVPMRAPVESAPPPPAPRRRPRKRPRFGPPIMRHADRSLPSDIAEFRFALDPWSVRDALDDRAAAVRVRECFVAVDRRGEFDDDLHMTVIVRTLINGLPLEASV